MVIFYKKWKKYNEIQLTKIKMDLNIRKMTNHPPSPVLVEYIQYTIHLYIVLYTVVIVNNTQSCFPLIIVNS